MSKNIIEQFGIRPGLLVQEFGWDADVDEQFRKDVESITDNEILDEDSTEVCDVILLWYRKEDGDLVDYLLDTIVSLTDDGCVWIFTPKTGSAEYVHPAVISEAANIAGLTQTKSVSVRDWIGTKLMQPKAVHLKVSKNKKTHVD